MVNMNANLEMPSFTCFRYLKVRHVISEVVCLPRVLVIDYIDVLNLKSSFTRSKDTTGAPKFEKVT